MPRLIRTAVAGYIGDIPSFIVGSSIERLMLDKIQPTGRPAVIG